MTASAFGTIIGSVSKDMKSVTTFTQSVMLLLYAPAILNLFPKLPVFLQKLFPTYYLFSPLLKLSEGSFVFSADGWELIVLILLLISLQLLLVSVINRKRYKSA
jgi:ABC-2 type transport system permease protein